MTALLTSVTDPDAWDAFVASSEKPHVMQSWAWGEVKGRTAWRPHRVALERGGALRVGATVLERAFPRTGRCFFYAPRGPVVAQGWTPKDLEVFFLELEALAASRKAAFLKIDPDVSEALDWITPHFAQSGFTPSPAAGGFSGIQPRCVFRLNIHRTEEELLKGMDQKTRY